MAEDVLFTAIRNLLASYGNRLYEHHVGLASLLNLCFRKGVISEAEFHREVAQLESSEDMKQFRKSIDKLANASEDGDFEALLREFEGPPQ